MWRPKIKTSSGLLFYKWGAPKETSYKQNLIHYHQKMERSRQMCLINGMIATKWGTHKTYELEYVSMGLGIPPFWNSIQYEYQWWYIKVSVSDLIKHGEPQKTHNPSPSKYRFPNSSTYQPFFSNPKCRATSAPGCHLEKTSTISHGASEDQRCISWTVTVGATCPTDCPISCGEYVFFFCIYS